MGRSLSLLPVLLGLTIGLTTPVPAADQPLYPLWPAARKALDYEEVKRLYLSFIKPTNSKRAPWFGNPGRCETGTMDPVWVATQEKLLNSYRELAGAPPARLSPEMNATAVTGALITAANRFPPEHYPAPHARCYSKAGAAVTARSSLAYGEIKTSINNWIDDYGVSGVGHRLPTIHPGYREMGVGAVGAGMVLLYPATAPVPEQSHIAVWPPPGYLPAELAFGYPSFTFSLTPALQKGHTLEFGTATARVKANGWPRPVVTFPGRPYRSLLFEVGYGDSELLKKQLRETGAITFDVTIGPVTVNGTPAEIRYRTVYFDPAAEKPVIPDMPMPGFYPITP